MPHAEEPMEHDGEQVRRAAPCVLEDRVGAATFRGILGLLAEGRPVTTAEVAERVGRPLAEVAGLLADEPGTDWDEDGRLVGFGLTLRETPFRLVLGERTLYTWCAMDTLFFPVLLSAPATVFSRCAATGVPIRLTVRPEALEIVEPAEAVVSEVYPEGRLMGVRASICAEGHFFASPEAGRSWLEAHPRGELWPVAKAFGLAVGHCSG